MNDIKYIEKKNAAIEIRTFISENMADLGFPRVKGYREGANFRILKFLESAIETKASKYKDGLFSNYKIEDNLAIGKSTKIVYEYKDDLGSKISVYGTLKYFNQDRSFAREEFVARIKNVGIYEIVEILERTLLVIKFYKKIILNCIKEKRKIYKQQLKSHSVNIRFWKSWKKNYINKLTDGKQTILDIDGKYKKELEEINKIFLQYKKGASIAKARKLELSCRAAIKAWKKLNAIYNKNIVIEERFENE